MLVNGKMEGLPLYLVVSNIETSSYRLPKKSTKTLSPLSKSEHTVDSAINFLISIRYLKIPNQHKKLSFDGKAMFTNFLLDLDNNINLILNKTNDKDETDANISKKVKDLHVFSFDGNIYMQSNGVAMVQL